MGIVSATYKYCLILHLEMSTCHYKTMRMASYHNSCHSVQLETTTRNSYKQEMKISMIEMIEDETHTFYLTKMGKGKLI
jgi:hypothetical protein